jgi:hypothetical protein
MQYDHDVLKAAEQQYEDGEARDAHAGKEVFL